MTSEREVSQDDCRVDSAFRKKVADSSVWISDFSRIVEIIKETQQLRNFYPSFAILSSITFHFRKSFFADIQTQTVFFDDRDT